MGDRMGLDVDDVRKEKWCNESILIKKYFVDSR